MVPIFTTQGPPKVKFVDRKSKEKRKYSFFPFETWDFIRSKMQKVQKIRPTFCAIMIKSTEQKNLGTLTKQSINFDESLFCK